MKSILLKLDYSGNLVWGKLIPGQLAPWAFVVSYDGTRIGMRIIDDDSTNNFLVLDSDGSTWEKKKETDLNFRPYRVYTSYWHQFILSGTFYDSNTDKGVYF